MLNTSTGQGAPETQAQKNVEEHYYRRGDIDFCFCSIERTGTCESSTTE